MIDEYYTWLIFGYHSDEIKPQSNKRIVVVCDGCGKYRDVIKQAYTDLCRQCSNIGQKRTAQQRRNMSEAQKKRFENPNERKKSSVAQRKRFDSIEARQKNAAAQRKAHANDPTYRRCGELNGNWKGGISTEKQIFRSSTVYEIWRASVIKRDKNICQMCGTKIGTKHVHHIKPYRLYKDPDISLNVDNGIPLCSECHRKTFCKEEEFESMFYAKIEHTNKLLFGI